MYDKSIFIPIYIDYSNVSVLLKFIAPETKTYLYTFHSLTLDIPRTTPDFTMHFDQIHQYKTVIMTYYLNIIAKFYCIFYNRYVRIRECNFFG